MTPKELQKLNDKYHQDAFSREFYSLLRDAAVNGKTSVCLNDTDLERYAEKDIESFFTALTALGFKRSYVGDSRLGEPEFLEISWRK